MDFFRFDSGVMNALSKAADYVVIMVLCVICCIPVITAGASFTAMYYVSIKLARGEEFNIYKAFFQSFKGNLRQATVIWVILFLVIVLLAYDWYLTVQASGFDLSSVFQIVLLVLTVLVILTAACIFPVLARFQVTIAGAFKTAVLFAFLHPVQMILVVLAVVAPYYIGTHYLEWFLGIWFFGEGFTLYYSSRMYVKYFSVIEKKFRPEEPEEEQEEEVTE